MIQEEDPRFADGVRATTIQLLDLLAVGRLERTAKF